MGRVEILLGISACLLAVVVAQTQPDVCAADTCRNGGTCVDGGGQYDYVCQCVGDYSGPTCEVQSSTEHCPGGDNIIEAGETRSMSNLPNQYGCFYLISIPNVPELRITFTYFDIEADKDEIGIGPGLTIDDARTDAETVILDNNYGGTSLGQTPTVPFTITVTGGQAWVEIYTDKTVVSPGFSFTVDADAIDCISNPCQNGGTCNDLYNMYTCTCPMGFTGTNCEIELDFCSSDPCQNDGTCTASNTGYTCACSPGWTGVNCEININECASGPCLNNGLCVDGINLWLCTCVGQFTGVRCEISLNACISSPCVNGGNCVNAGLDYVCECPTGFVGDHCEIDVNECSSLPCQNGATCIDGPGMYTCQCREGFSGTNCQDVGYCDLEGVWYNECNDRVTISLTSTGMVLGDYSSSIELLTGYAAPTVVVGYANQNCDFPSFGFVVTRDNGKSTSSWSGQCHLCDGQEVLYTTWTNTQQVNTCVDIKKATHIGQDKWTRYKQSQAPREE